MKDARSLPIFHNDAGHYSPLTSEIGRKANVLQFKESHSYPIAWAEHFLCRNAHNSAAWYCFHYAGVKTAGKESVNDRGLCEACEIATPPYEEAPSFLEKVQD